MTFDLATELSIAYPILGGAMTGVSDPILTAAISEAGALGIYASGMNINDIGAVREGIQECKRLTQKPFGVNIAMVAPIVDELMDYVCKENIAAITTGAGSPERFMPMLREAGVRVIPVIAAPRQAKKMAAAGVTAVVAEGMESGGNAGHMTTMPLIPAVADAVDIPIIAAGGIVDGRGMAAAFAMGACGIQMGTRFMLSKEARLCKEAQDFLLSKDGSETLVLGQRIGNKVNARVVMCPAVQKVLDYEAQPGMTIPEYRKFALGRSGRALFQGDFEEGYISAGMGIGAIHEVLTCKEIVERTMEQFNSIVRSMPQHAVDNV